MGRDRVAAVLFDFDYTLADSSEGVVDCVSFALRELGRVPPAPDAICRTIGLSLEESFAQLTGSSAAPEVRRFRELFIAQADRVMADRTVLYPGVAPVLDVLAARDVATGIVSTKFRYRIDDILKRVDMHARFDVIVGGEDVADPKPSPAGLRLALERLRVAASRCLYVGDSLTDAETAQRAGVPFIALLYGTTERRDFADYAPRAILSDLRELPVLIR
jgi:phosphoglycolate phosphatase